MGIIHIKLIRLPEYHKVLCFYIWLKNNEQITCRRLGCQQINDQISIYFWMICLAKNYHLEKKMTVDFSFKV